MSNRTVCSSTTGATGCSSLSRFTSSSSNSSRSRYRVVQTLLIVPDRVQWYSAAGRSDSQSQPPLDDDVADSVCSALQPFAGRNQPLRIVLLFSRASGAFHDSQSKRCHITVQSRQLGEKFPILSDHGRT